MLLYYISQRNCDHFNVKCYFLTGEEPEDSDFDLPKVYEPMDSFESLKERLNMFLSHYNESIRGTGMDMVFFQDAMIHLVKVLQGLATPPRNCNISKSRNHKLSISKKRTKSVNK